MLRPFNTANGHILKSQTVESFIIHPVNMATRSKFSKLKCLWPVDFVELVNWPCSCDVFRLHTLKRHLSNLWRFKSRFLKGFCVLPKESFQ